MNLFPNLKDVTLLLFFFKTWRSIQLSFYMAYQQFHISIRKQGILLLQIEYTHRFCQKQDFITHLVVIYFFSSLFLGKKAYSFEFKLRLVEEAKRSSNREVGRDHGISETCIRKWRKNEDKLIEASNNQYLKLMNNYIGILI